MVQSKYIRADIHPEQSPYWVITLRNEEQLAAFISHADRTNSVRMALVGPWEISKPNDKTGGGQRHCHAFIQFDKARRRQWAGVYAQHLKAMWIRPLEKNNAATLVMAKFNYLCYCIKEGKPQFTKGSIPFAVQDKINEWDEENEIAPSPEAFQGTQLIIEDSDEEELNEHYLDKYSDKDKEIVRKAKEVFKEIGGKLIPPPEDNYARMERETKENFQRCKKAGMIIGDKPKRGRPVGSGGNGKPKLKKTKTSDIIRDRILKGESRLKLVNAFPHMSRTIKDCLELHPVKYIETDCMYLFGGTGAGKTTTCKRVLNYFKQKHNLGYYSKMGGLSKFFDGYDWQPIILIDDPVTPDASANTEQIQMFKTIVNEHQRIIEIKGGSMPMDTGLIIITANISPNAMATACGTDCADAVYRRITKMPGAFFVDKQSREKLTRTLISVICQRFDLDIDEEQAYNDLAPIIRRSYDLHAWFGKEEKPPKRPVQQTIQFETISSDEEEYSQEENEDTPYSQLSEYSKQRRWAKRIQEFNEAM